MNSTSNDRISVEIEAEVEAAIPVFFKCRREDLLAIEKALPTWDFEKIKAIGHKMKGAAASFGFDEVHEIGLELEVAAAAADSPGIDRLRKRLAYYLEHVDISYV